jgi:hypothetical protein
MEEVHERLKRSSSSSLVLDIQSEDGTYRALETKADNTIELVPYNMLKRYTSASEMEIASNAVPMKEIGDGHEKSSSSSSVPFLQSQDGAYRTLETNAQSEEAYSTLEVFPYSTLEAVPYSTLEAAPYSTLEMVPYNMPKCYRSASEMQWTNYDTPVPSKGNTWTMILQDMSTNVILR